jgi:hypothetical protein
MYNYHGFTSKYVLENMGFKFVFLHMSKMKGVIFHHDMYINLTYVSWNLGLLAPFVGSCWGHAMSKCCQYATNDSKICVGLTSISI